MERRVLLLFCGLFVHHSMGQTQTPNPECEDLVALKNNAEKTLKTFGIRLSCTPNKNCSGVSCNGTYLNKSFRGTVVLQACHKPVSVLVHWGNRHFVVKDGQKVDIIYGIYAVPKITKKGNIVYVDLTLKRCFIGKCIPLKILDNQKIRVHCNDSISAMRDLPWSNPTHSLPHTQLVPKTDSKHNAQRSKTCKGLKSAEDSIEYNFVLITKPIWPGSKINCMPVSKCSGLNCSGVVNKRSGKEHFTTLTTIDYCSSPTTLKLHIDVPSEKLHFYHIFKDGESVEVSKTYQMYVTVHLKRQNNLINVSLTIKTFVGTRDLVKNMTFVVDPSHCHGHVYNSGTTKQLITRARNSKDKSLSKGAIAGIVVASVVVFALLVICGIWLIKNKRLSPRPAYYNNLMMSDDTDLLYDDSEPAIA